MAWSLILFLLMAVFVHLCNYGNSNYRVGICALHALHCDFKTTLQITD